MIHFTPQDVMLEAGQAEDGSPKRQLLGMAVPWGVEATVSDGTRVVMLPGSLPTDGPAPKLYRHHDDRQVVGIVAERVATDEGMMFTAQVARTAAGDEVLELAGMGALDSVSIGATPTKYAWVDGAMHVEAAEWAELSILPRGAWQTAKVHQVAAAPDPEPTPTEPDPTPQENPPMSDPILEAATVPTPLFAQPARPAVLPTAAEWIAASAAGGEQFDKVQRQVRAAAPDVLTTDTAGILPQPILAPVYNNFVGRRPVIDAVGARPMPASGKVFIRPEVTTHTSMATQATENTSLQSGTFVVSSNSVTKTTVGGYATVSIQDIDWTDPNVVQLLLDDMGRIYANKTDDIAADNLVSGASTTANFTDASIGDPAYWVEWLYTQASTILSASNGNLPTHLFVSPDIWAALGKLSDTADRPLFPQVGPMNAFGAMAPGTTAGNAFGLQLVVDRNFAADTLIVGEPSGFEIFEDQRGALAITNPDTISRTISWHGYFATLMIDPSKFVKAVFV